MKVLFLGDIVGRNARNLAQKKIAKLNKTIFLLIPFGSLNNFSIFP